MSNVERIFRNSEKGVPSTYNAFDPQDPDSYDDLINQLITDSVDYEDSTLSGDRDRATAYYYGQLPDIHGSDQWDSTTTSPVENGSDVVTTFAETYDDLVQQREKRPNRSTYVSTDVRDAVLCIMPSLIRIFSASENVIALVPRTEKDIQTSEQATDYINYTFWNDNPGFLILYGAFKDALTVRTGFVKWWTDDTPEVKYKKFQNISPEQLQLLLAEGQQSGQKVSIVDGGQPDPQTGVIDFVVVRYSVVKPLIKVEGVPPEEVRIDRNARTWSTSRITGHERVVAMDELIAMGYDRETVGNYVTTNESNNFTQESQMRNPGRAIGSRVPDGVHYGEWFIKVDKDGDGVPELRYICTMGEDHEIVMDEPANRVKMAVFSPDPISHTIVGDSVAELVIDIQRIKTNMMRGVLDSLAESINPKTVINELMVNVDDAMNDDLGAIIRTRGDPASTVMYTRTPFVGQEAVQMLEVLNETMQRRTGLSDAAKGLDPKALQSSTMIGVDAIISGAQERIELIARCLAETGFKDLFVGLYNEVCENPNQQRTLRIRGEWKTYDTSTFDASMGVEVNPTLGKGSDTVRMAALQGIKNDQQNIVTQYGLANPVCGIPEMFNTLSDMLELANIKNVNRYFKAPDPQALQQIMSAPKEPDAQTVAAKAMYEKVKSDTVKNVAQSDLDKQKLLVQQQKQQQDDLFRHQALEQKRQAEEAKIAQEAEKAAQEHDAKLAQIAVQHEVGMAKANNSGGPDG